MSRCFPLLLLFVNVFIVYSTRTPGIFSTYTLNSPNGTFLFPSKYPTVLLEGSDVNITWSTRFGNLKVILYQRNSSSGSMEESVDYVPDGAEQRAQSFPWTVTPIANSSEPHVLRGLDASIDDNEDNDDVDDFWSPMFFITQDPKLVEGLSSSSSISSPMSTPTLSDPYATTATTGLTDDGRATGKKKPQSIAAMAVGITLLVTALIICLLTVYFKPLQRDKVKETKLVAASKTNGGGPGEHTYEAVAPHEMEVRPAELEITPVEMEGTRMCSEMPVAAERRVRNEDLDELVS